MAGTIFFLNTSNQTVDRSYSLANLGIKDSIVLYRWENPDSSEAKELVTTISITLSAHQSILYFFSREPIQDVPFQLPS
jgi:hypothetical protein